MAHSACEHPSSYAELLTSVVVPCCQHGYHCQVRVGRFCARCGKLLEETEAHDASGLSLLLETWGGESRPPIPSSAQLIREYEGKGGVCACGHSRGYHYGTDFSCMGFHEEKPCMCPRFYA